MTLAPRKLWQEITLPYHPHHTSTTWTALLTYRGKRYLKTLYYRWSPSMMTPKMGYNCGQFRNNNKTFPEKIVKCSHKLYKYLQQKIYETDPALFAGISDHHLPWDSVKCRKLVHLPSNLTFIFALSKWESTVLPILASSKMPTLSRPDFYPDGLRDPLYAIPSNYSCSSPP